MSSVLVSHLSVSPFLGGRRQPSATVWNDVQFKELTLKKLEGDLEEQQARIQLLKKQTEEADIHCNLMNYQIQELQAKLASIEFVDVSH